MQNGRFPQARAASGEEEILKDPEIRLVCGAAITSERCALGLRVMAAGKDYFTDKAPLTTLDQLEQARDMVKKTGRKYMVYYSERLHVEAAVYAGQLIQEGAIGRVIQVLGMGPHRLGDPASRPDWFYDREKSGGILCDIGSHQIEQFLYYAGVKDAQVVRSQVANYRHKDHPGFDDFGDCMLVGDNGATMYFRVDWFTPDGLSNWGDGRTFILGTDGYMGTAQIRQRRHGRRHVQPCVPGQPQRGIPLLTSRENVGYPYFGQLILDCINRTETP